MPGAVKKNHSESAIPSLRQRSVKPRPQASTEIDHDQPSEKYAEIVAYESKVHGKTTSQQVNERSKWTMTAIIVMTLITRLFKINEPSEVVFDEVHFGGFASSYLRREYFFDVHPPLGKLLIAAVGYFLGYEGNFTFGSIGLSYVGSTAPYVAMRTMMVFFGIMTVALSYMTMIELGFSIASAAFSASLLIFDMAFCVQTRFILLDSPMIAFIVASLYSWVRFRKLRYASFTADWWKWLATTGAALGAATSVKMVGLFTVITVGIATIVDLWELADKKRKISDKTLMKHFFARALCLIGIPLTIYCACFYAHFAILNRTGPGDALMSPAFQATLIGNQMHKSSREVKYGHTVRIKSRLEEIFLHSHAHNYPQQHLDGKISSAGQQVTGYPSEDPNNLWQVMPIDLKDAKLLDEPETLKNGALVRLLHVKTAKYLMTHDVASPLTRTNMEITVCEATDDEKMNSSIWKIEITSGGNQLKTKSCQIKFVHSIHGVALTNWQQPLPAWGFGQREINGDKRGVDENSKWVIWDVIEPLDEKEKNAKQEAKLPTMSTLQKYVELQKAIFRLNAKLIDNHPFKSDPISWPFVLRGISFWDKGKDARIYMLGNIFAWYMALFGTMTFVGLALKELYRERRGAYDTNRNDFKQKFARRAGFIFVGWALHYFPFFTMVRTLYLHHYLPAYIMSTMLAGFVMDYLLQQSKTKATRIGLYGFMIVFTLLLAWTFVYFAPIVYGTFVKGEAMITKKWVSTWDWTA